MKRKFLFVLAMIGIMSFACVNESAAFSAITFSLGYVDPTIGQGDSQRGPEIPMVIIDGYTLQFITPCDGYTLYIVDGEGENVYTTVIPTGTTSLVLPSTLEGEYKIEIVPTSGNYYFYGYLMF